MNISLVKFTTSKLVSSRCVSRQAIEDEIRNLLVGNQLTDSAFDRQLQLASLLGSLGYSGNPDTTLLAGSNQQQQSADQMYQLLAALLAGG